MTHPSRRTVASGLATAAFAPSWGCARRSDGRHAALQLSWLPSVQFGGSYIAKRYGYWAREGLDVSLFSGGPNAPVEPPVASGQALVGVSAADVAAASVSEGAAFKIIAVAMQKNPFVIASLPGRPVNTPRDLLGRRLGMAVANMPTLQAVCAINKLDIHAITVVPTQYDAAPLMSGEVDCLLCWLTDLPIAMSARGVLNQTRLLEDFGYRLQSQTYIALEESLAQRRDEVVRLMRGELKGWQAFKRDTDAAASVTMSMYPDAGLDPKIERAQARAQLSLMFSKMTDEKGFGWFTDDSVQASIRTLRLLGQEVSPNLWDHSVLDEIYEHGPDL